MATKLSVNVAGLLPTGHPTSEDSLYNLNSEVSQTSLWPVLLANRSQKVKSYLPVNSALLHTSFFDLCFCPFPGDRQKVCSHSRSKVCSPSNVLSACHQLKLNKQTLKYSELLPRVVSTDRPLDLCTQATRSCLILKTLVVVKNVPILLTLIQ